MPYPPSVMFLRFVICLYFCFFFFNDTATTEIYTLSLHDALPILAVVKGRGSCWRSGVISAVSSSTCPDRMADLGRSEEHTSELQSLAYLVCRLLLEKKKKRIKGLFESCHILLVREVQCYIDKAMH